MLLPDPLVIGYVKGRLKLSNGFTVIRLVHGGQLNPIPPQIVLLPGQTAGLSGSLAAHTGSSE